MKSTPEQISSPHDQSPSRWRSWLERNWFILSLVVTVIGGVFASTSLQFLASAKWLQNGVVFVVMFLMALPLPWSMIRRSITRPWPAILGSLVNLVIIPLLAYGCALMLPQEYAGGLIVAACVPSTIASAAVWTRKANGDDTVAVLITLITNLSCAFVTPLWLATMLKTESTISLAPLVMNLVMLVVAPILLAQASRNATQVRAVATSHKSHISVACQLGILLMILMGSVQMGERIFAQPETNNSLPLNIGLSLLLVTAIHLIAMSIAWWLAGTTGVQRPQQIASAIGGSQKTLMIGLKLAMDSGVSVLPIVLYHVSQLLIDAIIAQRWARSDEKPSRTSHLLDKE